MKWIRKGLILIHRYLGIVLSLLFVVWFISGIGMMYAKGMPRLTAQLRLLRLPAIDLSKIRLTPVEAAARLGGGQDQPAQERPRPAENSNSAVPAGSGGEARGGVNVENGARSSDGNRGAGAGVGEGRSSLRGESRGRDGRGAARGQRRGSGPAAVGGDREDTAAGQRQGAGNTARGARGGTTSTTPATATGGASSGARGGRGSGGIGRVTVGAILDRPVYRLGGGRGGGSIVFADDGTVLDGINAEMAKAIAGRFMNVSQDKIHQSLLTKTDQWTIAQRRQLPLHKIVVDDESHTELYISPQSGEVAVMTTRGSRALAWVAAIPHWLYFTPLRINDRLWNQVIVWTSGVGCVLALIGIVLGITQFKGSRPIQLSRVSSYIPYAGLMRWHYITGVVFGIFTLTWVFSGLLSMDPWEWVSGRDLRVSREPFTGGPLDLKQYPPFDPSAWSQLLPGRQIKEIELERIQGDPYYVVRGADPERLLIAANPLQVRREPFDTAVLMDRLKQAAPDANVTDSQLLTDYDSYYYAQDDERPLPMLRAKFDDPKQTWVYIDPMTGQVAGQLHRGDRVQRWLYKGLHSLDFSFWYANRGVWEIGMIVLSIGGAVVSGIGLWLGVRRLGRGCKRFAKSLASGRSRVESPTSAD